MDGFVDVDAQWARRFEHERGLLIPALAPWLAGDIEHIGSTSINGMIAKPIIDMIAPVRDLPAATAAVGPLAALSYRHWLHRPEAHAFGKPTLGDWRAVTHHLHLTEIGSDLWRERLAFRDALRADDRLVTQYNQWKQEHLADSQETPYGASKTPLVAGVLAGCGIPLKPDRERLVTPDAAVSRRR